MTTAVLYRVTDTDARAVRDGSSVDQVAWVRRLDVHRTAALVGGAIAARVGTAPFASEGHLTATAVAALATKLGADLDRPRGPWVEATALDLVDDFFGWDVSERMALRDVLVEIACAAADGEAIVTVA